MRLGRSRPRCIEQNGVFTEQGAARPSQAHEEVEVGIGDGCAARNPNMGRLHLEAQGVQIGEALKAEVAEVLLGTERDGDVAASQTFCADQGDAAIEPFTRSRGNVQLAEIDCAG